MVPACILNRSAPWHERLCGAQVVVVSPQYWGNLWVSKHWIASELSRVNEVLFVEPPLWVGGLARGPLQSRWLLPRLLKPFRRLSRGLAVYSPRLWPHQFRPWSAQLREQARAAGERAGFKDPLVLNFDVHPDLAFGFGSGPSVYYCVDPVYSSAEAVKQEGVVCEGSDLILAISETYRTSLESRFPGKRVRVVPHGFDFERARSIDQDPSTAVPEELQALPRPLLGYVGSVHDAYVDVSRLERLSRAFQHASIVLIGPYRNNPVGMNLTGASLRRIRSLPNVHLLGPKPFAVVPCYVKQFDVALVQLNVDGFEAAARLRGRTLFKWLLYLSMGKPVVAPAIDEAKDIAEMVYLATSEEEYLENVRSALSEDRDRRLPRIEYARKYSFERVLGLLLNELEYVWPQCDR